MGSFVSDVASVNITIHSSRAVVWRRMAVLVSAHGTRKHLINLSN
jgi:hypothetical protein